MSDTSVVDNSTGKEKSRYTSGTIYKMIIAITFLLAFGLIIQRIQLRHGCQQFQKPVGVYRFRSIGNMGIGVFPIRSV